MKTDMLPQPPPDVNPTAPLVHTHHLIPARCEDLWGLMARAEDVLGVLTLYLSCQSRWKCLGLLMAHTDCHKNLSFTAAPTSKSLETSPVIPRGDEKGEVKREKDKWPPVLLCPDSSLEHPFPKWIDPTSWWTPWVATAEALMRLLQQRSRWWQQTDYSVRHKSHVSLIPLTPPDVYFHDEMSSYEASCLMDYETYKTNSSECFKWIKTPALEKWMSSGFPISRLAA